MFIWLACWRTVVDVDLLEVGVKSKKPVALSAR